MERDEARADIRLKARFMSTVSHDAGDQGKSALVRTRDTLNKAITVWIVLVGAAMADENCLLRVVGDSSILSVSPHRDRCGPGAAP